MFIPVVLVLVAENVGHVKSVALLPKFGALVNTVPVGVLGGAGTVLYGMIGVLGVRIWVQNRVDFSNPVNLAVAGVPLIIAVADYTMVFGEIIFSGIALGSFSALAIHHGMSAIAKWRGTDAGYEDEGTEAIATPVNRDDLEDPGDAGGGSRGGQGDSRRR